jgi:hypothetical protein
MSRCGRMALGDNYLERKRSADVKSALAKSNASPPPGKISRPLFHYTDARGLIGILETKCLFATHADFLNDSSECQLLKGIVGPQLVSEFEEAAKKFPRMAILNKTPEQLVDAVFNSVLTTIERTSPFYITSFCLHPDGSEGYANGLLSQWRGYASGGFAIQFDEDDLDQLTVLENHKFSHAGILTERVHYKDHAKQVDLRKFEGMAGSMLLSISEDASEVAKIFGDKKLVEYMKPFLEVVPFLKNGGFSEEQEYRSVALCIRPGHRPDIDKRDIRDVSFRVSSNGSVLPYVKLFNELERELSIKAVIIGPHHNQENQRKAVSLLLEQHKVKADVRLSKIPFREN